MSFSRSALSVASSVAHRLAVSAASTADVLVADTKAVSSTGFLWGAEGALPLLPDPEPPDQWLSRGV